MDGAAARRGEPGRDRRALHNMSALPTMYITIRPLRGPERDAGAETGRPASPALRCFAWVDLDALLRLVLPRLPRSPGVRLAGLVRLSQVALGQTPATLSTLGRRHPDALRDALRENAARIDARALGLPAFAVVRRARDPEGPAEAEPARALALVTRAVGAVFVAVRSPRVAGIEERCEGYGFYSPASAASAAGAR